MHKVSHCGIIFNGKNPRNVTNTINSGDLNKLWYTMEYYEAVNIIHIYLCMHYILKKRKKESCGTYTQWSITQPLKRVHLNQF